MYYLLKWSGILSLLVLGTVSLFVLPRYRKECLKEEQQKQQETTTTTAKKTHVPHHSKVPHPQSAPGPNPPQSNTKLHSSALQYGSVQAAPYTTAPGSSGTYPPNHRSRTGYFHSLSLDELTQPISANGISFSAAPLASPESPYTGPSTSGNASHNSTIHLVTLHPEPSGRRPTQL